MGQATAIPDGYRYENDSTGQHDTPVLNLAAQRLVDCTAKLLRARIRCLRHQSPSSIPLSSSRSRFVCFFGKRTIIYKTVLRFLTEVRDDKRHQVFYVFITEELQYILSFNCVVATYVQPNHAPVLCYRNMPRWHSTCGRNWCVSMFK